MDETDKSGTDIEFNPSIKEVSYDQALIIYKYLKDKYGEISSQVITLIIISLRRSEIKIIY